VFVLIRSLRGSGRVRVETQFGSTVTLRFSSSLSPVVGEFWEAEGDRLERRATKKEALLYEVKILGERDEAARKLAARHQAELEVIKLEKRLYDALECLPRTNYQLDLKYREWGGDVKCGYGAMAVLQGRLYPSPREDQCRVCGCYVQLRVCWVTVHYDESEDGFRPAGECQEWGTVRARETCVDCEEFYRSCKEEMAAERRYVDAYVVKEMELIDSHNALVWDGFVQWFSKLASLEQICYRDGMPLIVQDRLKGSAYVKFRTSELGDKVKLVESLGVMW